jgi:hypothetical protein
MSWYRYPAGKRGTRTDIAGRLLTRNQRQPAILSFETTENKLKLIYYVFLYYLSLVLQAVKRT